jgi:hypothetical protein
MGIGDGMGDKSRYRNMWQSEASGSKAGTITSWGRTRRPKELRDPGPIIEKYGWGNGSVQYGGDQGRNVKMTPITVTAVAAGDLDNNLATTALGVNGYPTENQHYLHLQIENDGTDDTVSIFAYNYAFGAWSQLYIPVGVKNGSDTTAELAYVAATFTTINGKKMVVVPIHGIDRVAFVHDGSLNDMVLRAAASSF